MRMGVLRDLTAAEKRAVLGCAIHHLLQDSFDEVARPRNLRQAIAAGLSDKGWWHMGVGGHREMDVTIEIQRALGLETGITNVEKWATGQKSLFLVIEGLHATIAYLQ